ncbi:MAG: hypothetical protein RQ753_07200 [Desulfurivibrionaceae bacterium]|nr:hypothetical protein [Desulfobacterales bacterium]MDT8335468.1 hypothetical protein [Desulfurivibrionaceae bacterium]
MTKILLTLTNDMIAPRFDLATEVLIVARENKQISGNPKSMLLPGPSADELCGLILKEDISILVCGGIEEEHCQFLTWKRVTVLDRVIGKSEDVIRQVLDDTLHPGDIVKKSARTKGGSKQ